MSSTIAAMFDDRPSAEAARTRLAGEAIHADHVHLHDRASEGYRAEGYSTHEDRGFWDKVKNVFLPDADRHTYEEGVRRGGILLTADVDADRIGDAMRALRDAGSVDIDGRASEWRQTGWEYDGAPVPTSGMAAAIGIAGAIGTAQAFTVGSRDEARSDARVRAYSAETPFHEQRTRRDAVVPERGDRAVPAAPHMS